MPNSRKQGRRASSAASAASSSPDITATGSTASSPPPNTSLTGTEPTDKKSRFEQRFKTATTSNEDVLQKQLKSWTSAIYRHFQPPSITQEDGEVTYMFVCKNLRLSKLPEFAMMTARAILFVMSRVAMAVSLQDLVQSRNSPKAQHTHRINSG
ncbi:hypothetical protein PILCRDRAFT_15923 [Piloderma croceum F 1598]|uniref:Uncharacterized protein n=1 Tax=Piloderma croceum (strain F 1598) TaxID=765440 RepID=A0A0C3EJ83_PILCF|nr:hypothetical protein PILCRDRAFT_15923 [Piloderma croceum F 1598]